jgi:hypothetical protein
MARGLGSITPEAVFYAALCAYAERAAVQPRFVELFQEGSADPEAVDTLADRDPGFRVALDDLTEPAAYLTALAGATHLGHVWSQVVDQLPAEHRVVPVKGTVQ